MTNSAGNGAVGSEPWYRVTVNLASQAATAYGKPQALQAGKLRDTDIWQERRRLYEWVLEPLYCLTGKFNQKTIACPSSPISALASALSCP